jgi:hypothetical protein
VATALLADYVACGPTNTGTDGCPNKRASSNNCAKYGPTGSANACTAKSSLLCSTHSSTPHKGKNKNKHNKNNHDTFHLISPYLVATFSLLLI